MPTVAERGGWQRVCAETGVAEGQCREFTLEGQPCFLVRRGGNLYAYHNVCPHLGITLNWQPDQFMDPDHCFIHCANHGALFTPESGECIAGPCRGDHLNPVAITVHEGYIEARL